MKTFVVNQKQTREFIANFKRVCYPLGAYNVTIDESVAIKRRLATFNTLSSKTFVVNVSDLNLVAVACDVKEQIGAIAYMNNLGVFKAPGKEIYSTHIDDNSPTIDEIESLQASAKERFEDEQERAFSEWCNSTEDNSCYEAPERILDNESSAGVDDDSHLSIDEVSDFITEINNSYTQNQQETALKAAKIIFHYWALSGNSWIVPYDYDTLADLIEYLNAQTGKNAFLCFVDKSIIGVKNLIVDEHSLSFGDDFDLFLQMLEGQAVNYGVYSWFTPSELSVYQQNYQHIVADCTAILELYRQSTDNDVYKGCEGANDVVFPTNINELFSLVNATCGNKEAIAVVNSIHDEKYLFFQVLSTMDFINSTASTVEA